jgi:MFS family permease
VKERPGDLGQEPDGGTGQAQQSVKRKAYQGRGAVHITTETWSYCEAITSPTYWLLILSHMGMSSGYMIFLAHGVMHVQDLGHSRDAGSWAISIMALAGLGAKVIVGTLGDRIDPRYIWAGFAAVFGVGQFLVLQADTGLLLIASACCLGIGFGGGVVCSAAVLSNYYGMKTFAALIGLTIAISTGLTSIAPSLAGWLYNQGYGYRGIFCSIAVGCGFGALVLFSTKPPVRKGRPAPIPA